MFYSSFSISQVRVAPEKPCDSGGGYSTAQVMEET